jgi:hypothetical protein
MKHNFTMGICSLIDGAASGVTKKDIMASLFLHGCCTVEKIACIFPKENAPANFSYKKRSRYQELCA